MTSYCDVTSWQRKQLGAAPDAARQWAHTCKKVINIPESTLYVTPSPTYLGAPSLPQPTTALLLYYNKLE